MVQYERQARILCGDLSNFNVSLNYLRGTGASNLKRRRVLEANLIRRVNHNLSRVGLPKLRNTQRRVLREMELEFLF